MKFNLTLFLLFLLLYSCSKKSCIYKNYKQKINFQIENLTYLNQFHKKFTIEPTDYSDTMCVGLYNLIFKSKDENWVVKIPLISDGEQILINTCKYNKTEIDKCKLNTTNLKMILTNINYKNEKLDSLKLLFNIGANLYPVKRVEFIK